MNKIYSYKIIPQWCYFIYPSPSSNNKNSTGIDKNAQRRHPNNMKSMILYFPVCFTYSLTYLIPKNADTIVITAKTPQYPHQILSRYTNWEVTATEATKVMN